MTFDEAKAIVQLMGYQVYDRTDRLDPTDTSFYADVREENSAKWVFDCRVYETPEAARARFVKWVDEFNAVPAKDTSIGFVAFKS